MRRRHSAVSEEKGRQPPAPQSDDLLCTLCPLRAGQIGYEDIVAEAGAADEYRAQLARVRARLAAARASLPRVVPSQERVVVVSTASAAAVPTDSNPLSTPTALAANSSGLDARGPVTGSVGLGLGLGSGNVGLGLGAGGVAGKLSLLGAAGGGLASRLASGGGVGAGLGLELGLLGAGGGGRVVGVLPSAGGTYGYTTLEDTKRLIAASRPYVVV